MTETRPQLSSWTQSRIVPPSHNNNCCWTQPILTEKQLSTTQHRTPELFRVYDKIHLLCLATIWQIELLFHLSGCCILFAKVNLCWLTSVVFPGDMGIGINFDKNENLAKSLTIADPSVKFSFCVKLHGHQDHLTAERLFKVRRIFRLGWARVDICVSQMSL